MTEGTRRRGRPRADRAGDTRQRLIAAARGRFAADGYQRASLRAIAADAGVDASLIRHYFGDKSGLLVASMQLPVNPAEILRSVIADGPDGLGRRLVEAFLTSWDPHREVIAGLVRTTFADTAVLPPTLQVVRGVVVAALCEVLTGRDAELRAELIAGQLLGLAMLRYVRPLDPLASAPRARVIDWYAPAVQRLVTPS
ncbi:MAG TPA: TetR family transcriptional regulator [Jatrophihabitans sp.]|nr:TetR family transcriptional regulator [Jatrophihabitans sp.]